jgi:hypothetical protein
MVLTIPPGLYFVGDPCYAFADDGWGAVCAKMESRGWPQCGKYSIGGSTVVVMMTTHGDGIYEDDAGNEYSVDSGTLGAVQLHLPVPRATMRHLRQCGTVVRFDESETCYRRAGIITVGGYSIDTN